jgi:two-component system, NarL family, response regulator DevR
MVDPATERREFQDRSEVKSGPEHRDEQDSSRDRQRAQLQQAQRMESLGQLAGGLADDFNHFLAVIVSCAAFVPGDVDAPSGPDWPKRLESARRDLGQITLAAERAAGLRRQPLALVPRQVARPQVLDLDHVAVDVQEMLRRTLGEHVELVTTLAGDLWPILADPSQQALLGGIMTGAARYLSKQAGGADLMSAARPYPPSRSLLDPYASRPAMARLRDGGAGEDLVATLTGQEKRVLELVGEGLTNRQIAERMFLAEKTAKNYVSSLLAKLGMHRRTEAAAFAARYDSDHN